MFSLKFSFSCHILYFTFQAREILLNSEPLLDEDSTEIKYNYVLDIDIFDIQSNAWLCRIQFVYHIFTLGQSGEKLYNIFVFNHEKNSKIRASYIFCLRCRLYSCAYFPAVSGSFLPYVRFELFTISSHFFSLFPPRPSSGQYCVHKTKTRDKLLTPHLWSPTDNLIDWWTLTVTDDLIGWFQ